MSTPETTVYPVGTRVRIGGHLGTVHPPQPRVTVLIDGAEIAEVPAQCVRLADDQDPAGPFVADANSALRELDAQRSKLQADADGARPHLMQMVRGDWTIAPSLEVLALYAARFLCAEQGDNQRLAAEVTQLRTTALHLPADWRTQASSVANWTPDDLIGLVEEWQSQTRPAAEPATAATEVTP